MEKGKFAITMKIEFDLSEEGAVEEFALMMAKIRDAGYPEFAEQVAQGIQVERMLVAFSQHRHKARQIDGMTAALNVALGEAWGR